MHHSNIFFFIFSTLVISIQETQTADFRTVRHSEDMKTSPDTTPGNSRPESPENLELSQINRVAEPTSPKRAALACKLQSLEFKSPEKGASSLDDGRQSTFTKSVSKLSAERHRAAGSRVAVFSQQSDNCSPRRLFKRRTESVGSTESGYGDCDTENEESEDFSDCGSEGIRTPSSPATKIFHLKKK